MASEVAPQPSPDRPGDRDNRNTERTEFPRPGRWEPEIATGWQLVRFHEDVCNSARAIITAKNEDYSGESDIFSNLHVGGAYGIWIRLGDKFSRVLNFERRILLNPSHLLKVVEEKIEETVLDLINYAIIYLAYKRRKRREI